MGNFPIGKAHHVGIDKIRQKKSRQIKKDRKKLADSFAAFLFVINTVILPAFLEEFVNRGIILGSLRRFGDRLAGCSNGAVTGPLFAQSEGRPAP